MNKTSAVAINFDRILIGLFYLFGFSLSFELVFELFFSIETIFKPFRIVSLLIIGTYGIKVLKQGIQVNNSDYHDIWVYGVFAYGFIISCIRVVTGPFSMSHFYNDTFQAVLLLLIFFIFKSIPMNVQHIHKVVKAYLIGVACNAAYILFNLVVLGYGGRQSGLMDNPNYVALSLVVFLCYLLLRLNYTQSKRQLLLMILAIPILLFAFDSTGSRTGLVLLILTSIFIFIFYSLKIKVFTFFLIVVMGFLLYSSQYETGIVSNSSLGNRISKKSVEDDEDVRFVVWKRTFQVMEEEGYAGMGIGQFKAKFPRYFNYEIHPTIVNMVDRSYFLSTHNDYMAILTDYGLPSLFCYLMYLFLKFTSGVKDVIQFYTSSTVEFIKRFSFLLFVLLITFGLTADNFQNPLFWLIMAIATKSGISAE